MKTARKFYELSEMSLRYPMKESFLLLDTQSKFYFSQKMCRIGIPNESRTIETEDNTELIMKSQLRYQRSAETFRLINKRASVDLLIAPKQIPFGSSNS